MLAGEDEAAGARDEGDGETNEGGPGLFETQVNRKGWT